MSNLRDSIMSWRCTEFIICDRLNHLFIELAMDPFFEDPMPDPKHQFTEWINNAARREPTQSQPLQTTEIM